MSMLLWQSLDNGVRDELSRELWAFIWRASRMYKSNKLYPVIPAKEGVDLITDSLLVGNALGMTPRQIFDLIVQAKWLLVARDVKASENMLQLIRNSRKKVGSEFDEELPF